MPGAHDHHHVAPVESGRAAALWWAIGLNGAVLGAEVVGGLAFHSLALLADSAHLVTDVLGLVFALVASRMARRPATDRRTYGWQRVEELAGFVNGLLLLAVSAGVAVEAVSRLRDPADVVGGGVAAVAAVGLAANVASAALLRRVMGRNLNLRAAWLHLLADALGSVAALVAGLAMLAWRAAWVDPAASLALTALLLWTTVGLLRDASDVLLDVAPSGTTAAITTALRAEPGVVDVHHLHVWGITSERTALSAHVVLEGVPTLDAAQVRGAALKAMLAEQFGVEHATLELEAEECSEG